MGQLKAKLRAWLIDLVREAIRIERYAEQNRKAISFPLREESPECLKQKFRYVEDVASKPVTATVTEVQEKTFEQLQSESIAAQEKYYEPAKL